MNILLEDILKVARVVYKKLFRKNQICLESDNDSNRVSAYMYQLLQGEKPCMIARYGSTELACICNYLSIQSSQKSCVKYVKGEMEAWWWNVAVMKQMQEWSGFFPPTKKCLSHFCELMLKDTEMLDVLGSWIPNEKQIEDRIKSVYRVHLRFLEPFWSEKPWTKALEGKRVVVVHPFANLIEKQYKEHRLLLFSNHDILPKFQLRTVKAVQSLGGTTNGFSNWFEALEWMKQEIGKEDYDIALIGCGAYGFPLAAHVKRQGKKAVHLGGALQLLFGIRGNRWDDPMYGVKEWGLPVGMYSSLPNKYWVRPGEIGRPQNADEVEGACYW